MQSKISNRGASSRAPSLARTARHFLRTLDQYREAKSAVEVAGRIGQDTRELEYHAAQLQAEHQEAVVELVSMCARMREEARA